MVQYVPQQLPPEAGIDGHLNRAEPRAGKPHCKELAAVRQHDGDFAPLRNAHAGKSVGQPVHPGVKSPIGESRGGEDRKFPVRVRTCSPAQNVAKRALPGRWPCFGREVHEEDGVVESAGDLVWRNCSL